MGDAPRGLGFIRIVMTPEERDAWLTKNAIETWDGMCGLCDEPCRIDTPFRWKGCVGTMAETCRKCGNEQMPFAIHWDELAALGEREKMKPRRSRKRADVIPLTRRGGHHG